MFGFLGSLRQLMSDCIVSPALFLIFSADAVERENTFPERLMKPTEKESSSMLAAKSNGGQDVKKFTTSICTFEAWSNAHKTTSSRNVAPVGTVWYCLIVPVLSSVRYVIGHVARFVTILAAEPA